MAAGGLTPHQQKMTVAIYVLAHHDKTVAAQYVHQTAQKQGRLPISHAGQALEECAEIAETLFLATGVEQLVSTEPDGKAQKHLQCLAHQWLACRSTALWVQRQNYSAGVAPSSSDIVNKYTKVAGFTLEPSHPWSGPANVSVRSSETDGTCVSAACRCKIQSTTPCFTRRLGVLRVLRCKPD